MGWEILAVVFGLVLLPLVVLGFVVFWWTVSRDRDGLEESWRTFARRRGFIFDAPSGEWPNRSLPAVTWTDGTTSYRLEARGRESRLRTRVIARPALAVFGELVARTGGDARGQEALGDLALDARVALRARPRGFARRIFTGDVRRAFLGFERGRGVTLAYVRGQVWLEWLGAEENEARLDEACAVVRCVVRAVERAYDAAA